MSTQRMESDGETDAIKSCIRIRPLNDSEREAGSRVVWEVKGDSITSVPLDIRDIVHEFSFDKLITSDETNEDVYVKTTREIITAAVDGFNGTIFAYGQTSSGKTHTIRGSYDTPGLLPLAVGELFDILEKTPNRQFLVRACYLEIYNEEIKDLLEPSALPLKLRETVDNNFEVVGVHEQVVVSSDEVFMLMEDGDAHRSVGSTKMNQRSSRSHSLFRITIESSEEADEDGESASTRMATLNFVDLAGSERQAKAGTSGERLKEACFINNSLLTLSNVINKLADKGGSGIIPYRESKLTRILKQSLGGNSKTLCICAITPADMHLDETLSTLRFAQRVKMIENKVKVNQILTEQGLLRQYREEVAALKVQLEAAQRHQDQGVLSSVDEESSEDQRKLEDQEKLIVSLQTRVAGLTDLVINGSDIYYSVRNRRSTMGNDRARVTRSHTAFSSSPTSLQDNINNPGGAPSKLSPLKTAGRNSFAQHAPTDISIFSRRFKAWRSKSNVSLALDLDAGDSTMTPRRRWLMAKGRNMEDPLSPIPWIHRDPDSPVSPHTSVPVELPSIDEHIQRRKKRNTLWTAAPISTEASLLEHPDRLKMSSSAADHAMASMAVGNWRLQMKLAEQEKLLRTAAAEKASLEQAVARLCAARFQGVVREALQRKSHCQEVDGIRADLEATVYANQELQAEHDSSTQKAHLRLQMKDNMVQQMIEAVRTHKQDAKDLREQIAKQSEMLNGQEVDVMKVHEELSAAIREKENAASNIAKAEEARKEEEQAKREAEEQAAEYLRKLISAERARELLQAEAEQAKQEAEQAKQEAETASGALKLQLAELQKKLAAIKQESDLEECESRTPNHQKSPRLSPRGSSHTPPLAWRRSPPPEEASPTDGKPRWNPSCPDLNRSKCARSKLMPALVTIKSSVETQPDSRPIPKH